VRVAFFVLLALNVVYLAWAGWIDVPNPPPVTTQPDPRLPQLALVTEEGKTELEQAVAAGTLLAQATVGSTPEEQPAGASAASSQCVSVGPFNDLARAAKSASLLRERGFNPRQRAEPGETWDGYWVYVGGLKSAADEAKVMKELERAGISDARPMPEANDGRRVSVGLFSEKERAERRAQALNKIGIPAAIVERKQTGTVYWVDMDLAANVRTVPTEGLLSVDDAGSRLEIRVCPSSTPTPAPAKPPPIPRDARPASTTTTAGVSRSS
jgi:cell division septation protein DedD